MDIIRLEAQHLDVWCNLAAKLWPEEDDDELYESLDAEQKKPNVFVFLGNKDGQFIGFVYLTLRTDYVQGCTDSPTAFLEGIYIEPEHRRKGYGRQFVDVAEELAREKGCSELGSDALIENLDSHRFHKAIGFDEVGRTVSFLKHIVPDEDN